MAIGISEPGWTKSLGPVPDISMQDVDSNIAIHSKVPGKHLERGYSLFYGNYVHKVEVKLTERGCNVRAKSWRSQKKNETPHTLHEQKRMPKELEDEGKAGTLAEEVPQNTASATDNKSG